MSTSPSITRGPGRLASILIAIGPVLCASIAGQVATLPNLEPWYASLAKPWFNPPNWIFGPVWTVLFALMAFAVLRLLRASATGPAKRSALAVFFIMLIFNAGWSWAFFYAHSPLLGLFDIVAQWLAIVATIAMFRPIDRLAAWCFAPLLAWVSFAAVLNLAIWRLNG